MSNLFGEEWGRVGDGIGPHNLGRIDLIRGFARDGKHFFSIFD